MARSGKTAQEFIQSSFSPIIAILCSPKVENVMSKNNLSFTELLQPFTSMDWEGQFREPGGTVCTIKNMKLIIRDVNWKPLQPTEARRQLNNAVLHNYNENTVTMELDGRKFDIPQSTPWFDAWRETYLEVQFPSDHEFTKHFVACIIVGTTHDDNIIDVFNGLNQQYAQLQNVTPPKLPKWFNNEVLKSYLLLNDVSSVPKEKSAAMFDTLKQTFGAPNCYMLSINSKNTTDACLTNDYWAKYIKRALDTNSESLSTTSTPMEPQSGLSPNNHPLEDSNTLSTSTNPDAMHPLTTNENDIYDNANSLQTHSFSGSSESVSVSGKLDYSTEVHGSALNANDIEAIKRFLMEYSSKALLPHLEKQISQLSEGVATRKGVSRSLISATKRWFGTGKSGNTTVNNTVIYSGDCQELQLRRLGDLWFLCGQWQRAFDVYHTAKREFYADSAWLCYAGALEMAALSAFMAGEANRKTHGYMEESIVTYLNNCRMVQYAVRATLLSVLCSSSGGLHGDAAKQLIRMTSEDSDLRSAMLLEQAALCFLSGPVNKAMCRKYAFHMVLAGHRFSKAGQKKHGYRCYKQAYQVYGSSGWRLATDHVQFALGRLAGALRAPRDAVRWLRAPLAPRAPHPSANTNPAHPAHPASQQAAFLREYMLAHQQWIESSEEFKECLPVLPLPLVEGGATSVLCVGPAPLSSPGRAPATSLSLADDLTKPEAKYWNKMEEMVLQVAQGSLPMIFKPTVDLYTTTTDAYPVVPQGEPIQISVTLHNPLQILLLLKDVEVLWKFVSQPDGETLNNELAAATGAAFDAAIICGQKIKTVLLEGDCNKVLNFTITPLRVGSLYVQGLSFKLINVGEGGNESGSLIISGKADLAGAIVNDKLLQIQVIPHAPCLQMTFSESKPDAISGEIRSVDVEFRNVGPIDMKNLHVAVSHPDCMSFVASDTEGDPFKQLYLEKYQVPPTFSEERAARAWAWRAAAARHAGPAGGGGAVPAGGTARGRLQLRPRGAAPALCLLAYYETGNAARPYRLLRHVFRFTTTEVVEMSITPRRSLRTVDKQLRESMNLAVELKNVSNEKNGELSVEVLEASLISRQWKLTDLTAARTKTEPLMAHEKHHLIFKARRILEALPDGKVDHTCLKIVPDNPINPDLNSLPYCEFLTEYKPAVFENTDLIARDDTKTAGLIQSMFVIKWKVQHKTKNVTAFGQHCLWLDCFTRAESKERYNPLDGPALQLDEFDNISDLSDAKSKNKDNVVVFKLEHSNYITHDFKARKLCLVPITINIVNCYGVPVRVFIDMSKKQTRETFNLVGWTGALSEGASGEDTASAVGPVGVSVEVGGWSSRRVAVRAACAAPGAYPVGAAFAVTSRRLDEPDARAHTHAPNNTSLLVVQNA